MSTSPAMSVPNLVIGGMSPSDDRRTSPPAASVHSAGGGNTVSTPAPPQPSGASATSASPPAPPSGSTGAAKRELPSAEEDEVDELRDDDPPPPPPPRPAPTPLSQPVVPSPKPSGGGSKSRKSSCDLCHHRKIKCDQVRPSCSSCLRKGHPCHYSEETEANNPHARRTAGASGTPSSERPFAPRPSLGSANGGSPAWMSSSSVQRAKSAPNGANRPASAASGTDRKRRLDRDRIVNGYGSSSDEGEGDSSRSKSVGAPAPTASRGVDNDLADMLGDPKDEEVDELIESGDESSARGKKRDASVDDELSGELLELASAPPKKKKSKPAIPEVQTAPYRHPTASRQRPQARASLPATLLPPTPVNQQSIAAAARHDSYSLPLVTLMQSLPSVETQTILFNTFFQDPFLTEGISLLQPQFTEDFNQLMERRGNGRLREGDATTLANAFAFLAVALRVLPEETGKLLLASGSSAASNAPRSASRIIANQPSSTNDMTPLDQRYFELALLAAQIAEQRDAPSVMYVVHKFMLFRYATIGFRKDKVVLAGAWLAQAIKTAQALGMGKEWEGIPQGERELRRRVFWALFIADRQFAFDTAFPYTINDAHVGVHMPSPIAENELYKIPPEARVLPAHSTEAGPTSCTALFIHTHLARRLTPVLDAFACDGPSHTRHDLVIRFDSSLDAFQEALPPYLRLFPHTDTRFDSQHPYLPPHRVRLHSTLLGYRLGIHRSHLANYLQPTGTPGVRAVIAQVCLASIRCQKSAKMLDPKLSPRLFNPASVFEAAATLALIMYVERAVAATDNNVSGITMSSEYLAMRAGVADGLELLDSLGASSENAGYAHAAVRVLREVTSKVDAGPRVSTLGSTSPTSAKVNGNTSNGGASPSPSLERSPSATSPTQSVVSWLDSWRTLGINVDYVLREADWTSWEKIISGM